MNKTYSGNRYHEHYLLTSEECDKNGLLCSGCNQATLKITECKECKQKIWNWVVLLGRQNGNTDVSN